MSSNYKDIGWAEYAVFLVVLSISVGIGIFYGCFGSKQKSTKEYLLANRQMSAFPVALSMICSAVSAITLLSNPVEVYLYGLQYLLVILSFIPFNLSLAYLYIPVYFNLNVKSAYEFIEIRFNSTVRLVVSLLAVLHVIVSMAIAIYAPSLAIEQVTGIRTEISTAVIYFVCIFYSAIGGLKAVLYTDVFQAFIMLASLAVIAGKGIHDVGGLDVVWERASDFDRLDVLNFDPDPRTRHTVWTCIIAGYFFWIPSFAGTQIQVQRFLSMPDLPTVMKSLWINFIGLIIIISLCFLTGLIIFAKYFDCDPIGNEAIEKSDQLVPYFVEQTVDGIPGLLGLFIAGLTCASMSSLSSGLTALASITTYDYISKLFPKLPDSTLSKISKINTFALGMVSYCFVFVIQNMGSILPTTSSFLGIMLGPTLGIFTLGMMFPWANAKGSLSGMVSTFVIMITFIIFNNIYSSDLPDQKLPLSTTNCYDNETSPSLTSFFAVLESDSNIQAQTDWKDNDDSFLIRVLSISYMWYSGIGCILAVVLGLLCSLAFNLIDGKGKDTTTPKIPAKCISPPILYFLRKYFPNSIDKLVCADIPDNDKLDTDGENSNNIDIISTK